MRRARRSAALVVAVWLLADCIGTPVTQPDITATPSFTAAPTDRPVTTPTPVPTPTLIPQPADKPPVSFARADLARGSSAGVMGTGPITLAATGLGSGTYDDPFGARGIAFQSGSWTSEWMPVAFAFDELVASWNADTPPGTWIKVEMQARGSGRETKFFTMITWASTGRRRPVRRMAMVT